MFYDNELRFLQKMLTKCHLQNLIINYQKPLDERLGKGLKKLFGTKDNSKTFSDFFPTINPNTVYRLTDVFLCRYIFFELPLYEEKTIFIIGPYLNTVVSHQQILEQEEKMRISPKLSTELEHFYASLPVIKEENHIFAMVNTFTEFLLNGKENFESLDINRENSAAFISNNAEPNLETSILSINEMENRYDYENELMSAVSHGNLHKAELLMSSFSPLAFESRTRDQLRNIKNYCIIMNTLLRKAAESGGVHPVYLDSVSSDFAKKIENIHSMAVVQDFMFEILKTYCNLVKTNSVKNYSPFVQKAIIKIESDLTCDLSLREMAKMNNVSPSYFSGLFKKETGQTLTEYVNNKRVALAKHLLKNTGLQIQTIAQHCGILDFHYFCRLFKNAVGKTPTQYRDETFFN